ncbi:hypothetical protein LCGC14_2458650, partial [marine sediment metagenome]
MNRSDILVAKIGGSTLGAHDTTLEDIVALQRRGVRPVVVHGGGAAISRAMVGAGVEARFIHGRRYTDDATLEIVERVLAGDVNRRLAARINELGGVAEPLNFGTTNVLFGRRIRLPGEDGDPMGAQPIHRLGGVGVKKHAPFPAQRPDLGDRLDDAGLVV